MYEANFSVLLKEIDDDEAREFLVSFQKEIMEFQKKEWEKARRKLEKSHMIEKRNVRAVCLKEITETVKDYALESAR